MKQKVHTNDLRVKLGHPGEERMCMIAKHLHYSIKGTLDICEECATEKSNRNSYKKWRRSATSSREKSYILILHHKRNQDTEVLIIRFSYNTVTQTKMVFLHKEKILIALLYGLLEEEIYMKIPEGMAVVRSK